MAGGSAVDVVDDDPTGLDAVQDPDAGEPLDTDPEKVRSAETPERSRSSQPGL